MRIYSLITLVSTLFLGAIAGLSAYAEPVHTDVPKLVDAQYYSRMPSDMAIGDEKAPITMIEYASLSCTHCAHFQTEIFPEIQKNYIDTGKVLFINRDFPLDEPALRGAMLVRCADKSRQHTFLKVLFEKQESWAFQANYLEILENIGKLGGVSSEKFNSCMKDKALEDKIVEGKLTAANTLDISSTPSFFINGKKYNGANSYAVFAKILDEELASQAAAKK